VPAYFAATDEPQFASFLDGKIGVVWVVDLSEEPLDHIEPRA
jgi:hypothetical protein